METSAHPKSGPRDVFLYLLAIITLYFSVWRFIDLIFEYVNATFPDKLHPYTGSFMDIRIDISTLIVIFPVYIGLMWFLRKDAIRNPEKRELKVRKWLLYFTLFVTAITVIVDLVVLINTFLEGELTMRFLLKILTVFIVAGGVFSYYFWDLRRETLPTSRPSRLLAFGVSALVLITVASGFFIIGSPGKQRKLRFDSERLNHLSMLQGQVIDYWILKNRMPQNLDELKSDITGFRAPTDPETDEQYGYRVISKLTFELCAVFDLSYSKQDSGREGGRFYVPEYAHGYNANWYHGEGRACFTRTIDPDLYTNRLPKEPAKATY